MGMRTTSLLAAMGAQCAALLLCLVLVPAPIAAQDAPDSEVDYVELAAVLTRDGAYARAEAALANIDPAAEGLDLVRYHTVRGTLALEQQRLDLAAQAFADAIAAGQDDPLIHLYRAQALFGLERYDEAVAALDTAGDAVAGISGAWNMRAHALWMQKRHQQALATLSQAAARFPANTQFQRRQVFYLIELGLYQEAADLGRDYLSRSEGKAEDYVAIGTALRQTRSYDEALQFLETAAMRFPDDRLVPKALAQVYLGRGEVLAAAEILARLALREPALNAEAAELFRRAGHHARALALNARVTDPARKLKQRIGLLVEARDYAQVASMEEALYRAGLLEDEDVRYALAYAQFVGGDFAAAERHLQVLKRPELFRKATELRRIMQECGDNRWSCA